MTKKILVALIAVVVVAASVAFGWYIGRHPADSSDNTNSKPYVEVGNKDNTADTEDEDESTLKSDNSKDNSSNTEQDETKKSDPSGNGKTDSKNNTSDTKTDSTEKDVKELLIGSWTDNANFSGYEFMEDGVMKVTYFNMELLDLDDVISGTYTGTYTFDGKKLTVNYTIYSKAVTKVYTVKVNENTLTLKDEKGESSIYVRKGASAVMENVDKKLLGSWKSNLNGYEFKDTGVVAITFIDLSSMGITLPINGTVNGVYTLDGDTLTVKYSIYTGVIKKKFKYSIDGKVLTLTDLESGEKGTYIKNDN